MGVFWEGEKDVTLCPVFMKEGQKQHGTSGKSLMT